MADNAPENVKAFNLQEFITDSNTVYDGEEEDVTEISSGDQSSDADEQTPKEKSPAKESNDLEDDEYLDEVLLLETEDSEDFTQNELFVEDALDLESLDWSASSFIRLGCLAHGLQLVIKDTISSSPLAKTMVERIMAVITFFNNSNRWNSKLVTKTKLTVVTPGATRWNGIIFAMERLLKVLL